MFHRPLLALIFAVFAAATQAAGDPAKGKPIGSTLCAGCHGVDGQSPIPGYPHLAGQHPEYMAKQLRNFKAGDGKPALRKNDIMNGMVMTLSDDDMINIPAYFAAMTPKAGAARNGANLELGKRIWLGGLLDKGVPACSGCHGSAGHGLPVQYPRIANQSPDYTEAQLKAFRTGDRANDPEGMMRMIAEKLSDTEMRAVADYAATLQ
jgi:cytochrome c553